MPFELAEDHTAPCHPPAIDWSHWTDDDLRGKAQHLTRVKADLQRRLYDVHSTEQAIERELSRRANLVGT
jgi:hypothetical protein